MNKPSIEDLEQMLNDPSDKTIQINPDGSLSVTDRPKVHSLDDILTKQKVIGGDY